MLDHAKALLAVAGTLEHGTEAGASEEAEGTETAAGVHPVVAQALDVDER